VRPEAAQQVARGQAVLVEFGCGCRIDTAAAETQTTTHDQTGR
jgi:hypothetical protein